MAAKDQLLCDHGFDLRRLLKNSQDITFGYGSDFCPLNQLEKLLGGQPEFAVLEGLVKNGMEYCFKNEINETERLKELRGMIARGNHESAEEGSKKAAEFLAKDVSHRFSIPVSPEIVKKIRGAPSTN